MTSRQAGGYDDTTQAVDAFDTLLAAPGKNASKFFI